MIKGFYCLEHIEDFIKLYKDKPKEGGAENFRDALVCLMEWYKELHVKNDILYVEREMLAVKFDEKLAEAIKHLGGLSNKFAKRFTDKFEKACELVESATSDLDNYLVENAQYHSFEYGQDKAVSDYYKTSRRKKGKK